MSLKVTGIAGWLEQAARQTIPNMVAMPGNELSFFMNEPFSGKICCRLKMCVHRRAGPANLLLKPEAHQYLRSSAELFDLARCQGYEDKWVIARRSETRARFIFRGNVWSLHKHIVDTLVATMILV